MVNSRSRGPFLISSDSQWIRFDSWTGPNLSKIVYRHDVTKVAPWWFISWHIISLQPIKAEQNTSVTNRNCCYQLLPCHCCDDRSWCSESHWRQMLCMTESPELSAACITSCTNGAAFTSSSFTARRYAARSLLHWRYAFIYRERGTKKECECKKCEEKNY